MHMIVIVVWLMWSVAEGLFICDSRGDVVKYDFSNLGCSMWVGPELIICG